MTISYLEIIAGIDLTIGGIFLLGMTIRFYIGWIQEAIQKQVEKDKQKKGGAAEV